MSRHLPPFWAWERPFWKGFFEGLALIPLWRAIGRILVKLRGAQ